jgi:hypothetical protein
MINIKDYVSNLDLYIGQTYRSTCPVCSRKNTFTVTNDNGTLVWNCYANSCTLRGKLGVGLRVEDIRKLMHGSKDKEDIPFVLPEWIVKDHEHIQTFRRQNSIHDTVELRFDVRDSRIVFTVMDKGKMVDAVGRHYSPEGVGRIFNSSSVHRTPKWKRYGNSRRAYTCGEGSTIILVEDCISATQALHFQCTGFAIMGTALLREHIEQLQDYSRVLVALDPDAMAKTVAYTRELKAHGIDAYALKLYDDLKYRQPQDMQRVRSLIESKDGTCLTEEPTR